MAEFEKKSWSDNESSGTPITATEMNRIEEGLYKASNLVTVGTGAAPATGIPGTIYVQATDAPNMAQVDSSWEPTTFNSGWEQYAANQKVKIYRVGKLRIMLGALRNSVAKKITSTSQEQVFEIEEQDVPPQPVVVREQYSSNTTFMVQIQGTSVTVGRVGPSSDVTDGEAPAGRWWNMYAVWCVL